ncbi:MAG: nucleotide exchange factor GrpE [Bacteroidota bacterium]|nr:nucleotide exchange factor GrpE [Bacteroidota bacterium]
MTPNKYFFTMEEQLTNNEQQNTDQPGEAPATPQKSETEILTEKIAEVEKQSAQLKDQLLRKAAEFENYKRRMENDALNFAKFAGENIISQLLPVLDDLSRSLKSGKEKFENDPLYKGLELIFSKFSKMLEAQGVKPMETVGKEFNVDFHDALMQVPRSDVAPHTIVEEVEKGYLLYDKVIRHAKVIVSTSPVEEEVKN